MCLRDFAPFKMNWVKPEGHPTCYQEANACFTSCNVDLILFPYLSVMLPSPGPVWHHWEAYTIWPGAGGEICEVCEGEDRDRAELCQTTEVDLELSHCSPAPSRSKCSNQLVFAWAHVKKAVKCVCSLVTTLGQNLTCLGNTGLILQLQRARSSPRSLFIHGVSQSAGSHLV